MPRPGFTGSINILGQMTQGKLWDDSIPDGKITDGQVADILLSKAMTSGVTPSTGILAGQL